MNEISKQSFPLVMYRIIGLNLYLVRRQLGNFALTSNFDK